MTVATGFDVDYYLDQVGADYYLTAAGEPPGIWAGQGAAALGLRGQVGGDKASAKTMRALFHYGIGPDGVPLASRQQDAEADTAGILAEETAGELAVLRIADAARREWAEAHASEAAQARAAEGELRRRDQAERVAQAGEDGQEPHVETGEEFRARLPQIVAGAEARYAAEADTAEPEAMNEPAVWQQPESQAQAEATPEPSWEPGEAVADMDFEAEI